MGLINLTKNKKNTVFIILFAIIAIGCLWAFISAGLITKSFRAQILDESYKNKEANIENILVTETKDGEKHWELYADSGIYSDSDNIVLLENPIGNFYDKEVVKASFKAEKGTYNADKKEVILYNNVLMVYLDGTNISTDRIKYTGKGQDITAEGNVIIEKPDEAVIMGTKAILSGDFTDFHIEGRTKTKFYM
ncbi:MAG: LPS export ABC transporter periplasmic protein LptC [Candidatus Gastranaerophilales bacterium]|nr:LPS export ABC transporter periplasmic protein LptC [Candidatus Gastranaerophilales bacterium]